MSGRLFAILVAVAAAALLALQSFYTVDEVENALIVQLGKPVKVVTKPGLHFKTPFIQTVTRFDDRLLHYDASPSLVVTKDKKNLVIDNFAKWRITDPLQFYQTVRNETGAQSRLDDIIFSNLRQELGKHELIEIIADQRSEIMETVTTLSTTTATEYGIEIVDVRIKRADLPPENEKAVYERMQAERQREAKLYRSEGEEKALAIRAEADKERTILISEAEREAQILRGEGDAAATRIYAEAYNRDRDFFEFLRSMESYRQLFDEEDRLILSPDSEFLRFLKRSR